MRSNLEVPALPALCAALVAVALVMWMSAGDSATARAGGPSTQPSSNTPGVINLSDYTMKTLDGKDVNLGQYKGKVVLVVNTASKCGFTPQYAPLEQLHERFAPQGLAVLGFPCNQFGHQEPGDAKEISTFCTENYGVKFDMFSKIDVNGANRAPLYRYLTSDKTDPGRGGDVKWNFEKFLIGRDGKIIQRFGSKVTPDSPEMMQAIETALAEK
jgi:glutathione peroxidase